jgi:RimJ/RimL family protein N-acetyltransferase
MNSQLRYGNLLLGRLVRLAALDPDKDPEIIARWSFDAEYRRLLDSDPARPERAAPIKAELEKRAERENSFGFGIHTVPEDRLIGFVNLWIASWASAEAFVGIGIGERAYWGKGYGTDAMQLALRFAFSELNLERVSLEAFANNTRAIRSYEKAGFWLEGVQREWVRRDGQRGDVVSMGVLREEWAQINDERDRGNGN